MAVSFHSPQALDFSNSKELGEAPVETAAPVATKGGGRRPFVATGMGISLFHTSIDIEFICIYNRKIGKGF